MRLLLDTHAYLWWLADDARLSEDARRAIGDRRAVVHVSVASLWEIAVKQSLGRLELSEEVDLAEEIEANGFVELPIRAAHVRTAATLPPELADPFARLLIGQARSEGLVLAAPGREAGDYGVATL